MPTSISTNGRLHTVVFDFGGVLLDWDPWYLYQRRLKSREEMQRFLTEVGFSAWNRSMDAGLPFAQAVEQLSARFPQYTDLIRLYDERWEETIAGPVSGSVEILKRLKASGCRLYGLSNFSVEKFRLMRARYPFFNLFEAILLSAEVGITKPDVRVYELLLERIGRPPEQVVFIDDTLPNIETANRLGFRAIHFVSPEDTARRLEEMGVMREKSEE